MSCSQCLTRKKNKDVKYLRKAAENLIEAIDTNNEAEVVRLVPILNEKYELYKKNVKPFYECKYFGEAIDIINESLGYLYTNNKKILKEFAKLLKEDGNLSTQYKFYNLIDNFVLDGDEDKYLQECTKLFGMVDKGSLNESNEKLFSFIRKHKLKPSSEITSERMKMYEDCDYLLRYSKKMDSDVNKYITSKNGVEKYLSENKKVMECENHVDLNEQFNEFVENSSISLNEDERKLVDVLIKGNDTQAKMNMFEEVKSDCLATIKEFYGKCKTSEEKDEIKQIRESVESMKYGDGATNDVIKMIEITEALS